MSQFNFGTTFNPTTQQLTLPTFGQATAVASTKPSLGSTFTLSTATTAPTVFGNVQTTIQSSMFPTLSTGTSTASTLSLTLPTTVTTTNVSQPNTFHGLGGLATSESQGSGSSSNTNKSTKEAYTLPPEIAHLVDSFKQFVKEQKLIKDENSQQRFSIQPILEVETELEENLKINLHKLELDLQRNAKSIESLKKDTTKLLSNAEMAYRITRIDPPSSSNQTYAIAQNQYINASTHQYFLETVIQFQTQMERYSKQIDELKLHLENMNKPYGTEELFQAMKKQHETLVSLASSVYAFHDHVSKLKQQNNKSIAPQTTIIQEVRTSIPQTFLGPNPFLSSDVSSNTSQQIPLSPRNAAQPAFGVTTTLAPLLFQSPAQLSTPSTQFQLSSANISHSRAKRWTTS